MKFASELSHIAIKKIIDQDPIVFLPIGSLEQHGYLPSGIDNLLAEGYAKIFSEKCDEVGLESLIFPVMPFGFTPLCQGYPGSISLSKETFQSLMREVLLELLSQGFKKVVVVNGHRDNQSAIDEVIAKVQLEHSEVTILNPVYAWLRTTEEFSRKYPDRSIPRPVNIMDEFVQKVGLLRHADAAEMSLLYAIFPEKKPEFEQKLPTQSLPDLHHELPSTHDEWLTVTAVTKGGAGDPRGVDIQAAHEVIEAMVNQLLEELS
jgi:creatinine amidohydrolase/Fe(II)-dependent formamide hydrolase-like protein